MECNTVRSQLENAFDLGASPSDLVLQHLPACPGCAAYQQQLAALDSELRAAPPVMMDPALVARIQASIAAQPARESVSGPVAGGIAALVLLALSAGWFVDLSPMVAARAWTTQAPELALRVDWASLYLALWRIPEAVVHGSAQFMVAVTGFWADSSGRLVGLFSANSTWVWLAFGACMAAALALNASEAMGSPARRFRNRENKNCH